MESIKLFVGFIDLCLGQPIAPEDIREVLLNAHDIEILNRQNPELLAKICKDKNVGDYFLRKLTEDPPKYILKKIINSGAANFRVIKIVLEEFESIFLRERLVKSLAEIMVEVASIDTVMRTPEMQMEKKSEILSKITLCEVMKHTDDSMVYMLKDINKQTMDLLVKCLLNKKILTNKSNKYCEEIAKIIRAFVNVLSLRDGSADNFFQLFVDIQGEDFVHLCLKYDTLRTRVFELLNDNLFKETIFYQLLVNKLVSNENHVLMSMFIDYLVSSGIDLNSELLVSKF